MLIYLLAVNFFRKKYHFFIFYIKFCCLFSSERRTFSEFSFTTSWLTEDSSTRSTCDNRLSMRENSCNVETSWALNVHEI